MLPMQKYMCILLPNTGSDLPVIGREGERKGQRKRVFPQQKTKPIGNRRPGSEPEDATQDKILHNMNFLMS